MVRTKPNLIDPQEGQYLGAVRAKAPEDSYWIFLHEGPRFVHSESMVRKEEISTLLTNVRKSIGATEV